MDIFFQRTEVEIQAQCSAPQTARNAAEVTANGNRRKQDKHGTQE